MEHAEICLWENSDDDVLLKNNETIADRELQWSSSRQALSALNIDVTQVEKDEFGKPHSADDFQISISHCKSFSAAIKSKKEVGIDIEEITPRIERIASKFLNETDEKFVQQNNRLQALYLVWCAKEALYKLYGKKAVDFKKHIVVEPFLMNEKGSFTVHFLKHEPTRFTAQYEMVESCMLVWVVG